MILLIYTYGSPNYLESGMRSVETELGLPPVERTVYLPALQPFYDGIAHEEWVKNVPVLSQIFAPALYCWAMVWIFAYAVYRGQWGMVLWLLLPLLYGCTLLLGPTVLVRYVYLYFLMVPIAGGGGGDWWGGQVEVRNML